jgi:uncharacterized protein
VTEPLAALENSLRQLGPVVVAYSGGADSTFLAVAATRVLGAQNVRCVTAVSPSLAQLELDDCRLIAEEWGLSWTTVDTDELANPAYSANDGERCYHCKVSLMDAVGPLALENGATVVLGVNLDDLGEHRPGQRAAAERGARFPLVDAGFTKQHVRDASRALGLITWDKPAAACLASRVPYGTAVTVDLLSRVERAEAGLRAIGFRAVRVRHYGDTARVELPVDDLPRAVDQRDQLVTAVKAAGYSYVTVDLEGLRSGNLNAALNTP